MIRFDAECIILAHDFSLNFFGKISLEQAKISLEKPRFPWNLIPVFHTFSSPGCKFDPNACHIACVLVQDTLSMLPLSTQEYKWVPDRM